MSSVNADYSFPGAQSIHSTLISSPSSIKPSPCCCSGGLMIISALCFSAGSSLSKKMLTSDDSCGLPQPDSICCRVLLTTDLLSLWRGTGFSFTHPFEMQHSQQERKHWLWEEQSSNKGDEVKCWGVNIHQGKKKRIILIAEFGWQLLFWLGS